MVGEYDESVLWEPCGFADLIATCYGGVTRKVVEKFAQSKKVFVYSGEKQDKLGSFRSSLIS